MLAKCAPGYVVEAHGKHKLRVKWRNKLYYNLPKGDHGRRPGRGEIQRGHVRDLVTHLGILDCAREFFDFLR
jgi:hypothetical protein